MSIIELASELSKNKDIDFGEILLGEIVNAITKFSKDLDFIKKIIVGAVIKLSEECNMRYEYAQIHLQKKDFIRSSTILFKQLIKLANKLGELQNKQSGIIIFENLLFQMNKHTNAFKPGLCKMH